MECAYIYTQTEWNQGSTSEQFCDWRASAELRHINQVSGRSVVEWVMGAEVAATRVYLRRLHESDLTLCYLIGLHSSRLFTHKLFFRLSLVLCTQFPSFVPTFYFVNSWPIELISSVLCQAFHKESRTYIIWWIYMLK